MSYLNFSFLVDLVDISCLSLEGQNLTSLAWDGALDLSRAEESIGVWWAGWGELANRSSVEAISTKDDIECIGISRHERLATILWHCGRDIMVSLTQFRMKTRRR